MLKLLAALAWFVGAVILFQKGSNMLLKALTLEPENYWPYAALVASLILGGLKAEGVEPVIVMWALTRELRTLATLDDAVRQGNPALQQFDTSCFTGEYLTGGVTNNYDSAAEALARPEQRPPPRRRTDSASWGLVSPSTSSS